MGSRPIHEQRRFEAWSVPVDEVMDAIEPDQSDENEIDSYDEIEQPRHDQDQNPGNESDNRRDMGSGDDHCMTSVW
jgi:hypothetical protein